MKILILFRKNNLELRPISMNLISVEHEKVRSAYISMGDHIPLLHTGFGLRICVVELRSCVH